jgi:hypothetical protein
MRQREIDFKPLAKVSHRNHGHKSARPQPLAFALGSH